MKNSLRRSAWVMSLAALAILASGCATHDTSVGTKIDDTAITAQVNAALLADPDVSGLKIGVETVAGVVQLSGFVSSQAAATKAENIASGIDGVSTVKNALVVRNE